MKNLFLFCGLFFSLVISAQRNDTLRSDSTIRAPEYICPNDGCDADIFLPSFTNRKPVEYQLYVLDRWGTIIFESKNQEESWNGTEQKTKMNCKEDTYIWLLLYRYDAGGPLYKIFSQVKLLR